MSKEKVERLRCSVLTDKMDFKAILHTMSEGKPATLLLFSKLIQQVGKSSLIECLMILDKSGIYGSSIWKIFVENCELDTRIFLEKVHNVLDVA